MKHRTTLLAIAATFMLCSIACAKDAERATRMKGMREQIEKLVPTGRDASLWQLRDKPVHRYSDPTRNIIDASIWAVGRSGRPQAMVVLELYEDDDSKLLNYELTATSHTVDQTMKGPNLNWQLSGRNAEVKFKEFSAAGPPEATKLIRGRQMKEIAAKLTASEEWDGQEYELRVMPRPVLRYQDNDAGILDGSVFILARGTNAELLVLIEAQQAREDAIWQVAFARLGAASFNVKYDRAELWQGDQHQHTQRNYINHLVELNDKEVFFSGGE